MASISSIKLCLRPLNSLLSWLLSSLGTWPLKEVMLAGAVELFDVDHLFDDLKIIFTKKATNTHTAGSDAGTTAHALMLLIAPCQE